MGSGLVGDVFAIKQMSEKFVDKNQSCGQGWPQKYVIGGGEENLTNSSQSMLRFDQLESVNVEV